MNFFPLFLRLQDRRCVIFGGGELAARKIRLLMKFGTDIVVIAPEFETAVLGMGGSPQVTLRTKHFEPVDLDGATLVIVATEDKVFSQMAANEAHRRNLPVNVVDDFSACSFIMPSIIDRSPIVVAVSTGGVSPVLARLLRTRLEAAVPSGFGRLAQWAGRFRHTVMERILDPRERRIFWERILQGHIAELLLSGRETEADAAFSEALDERDTAANDAGEVYLVGAGPGDPDLLTVRALRLMQQADIVVHDRLVSESIVELTRRDATRIYVGKERDNHPVPQEDINSLLVRLAKEGNRVLRLKGGDPFIFGRGGEEIDRLAEHGIPFQVVPGVSAANGCAAYAGIPLTHRDHAHSCVFVTGHLKDGGVNLDWNALIRPGQTIVIYMGLIGLESICSELVSRGLAASTPAALVQQGTTSNQRVFVGNLDTLPREVRAGGAKAPTLIIIGDVVRLRDKLNWFR